MKNYLTLAACGLCLALAFCGCKPKAPYSLVPISGVATYKGTPLPEGFLIQFEPTDGSRPSSGIIREGGKFEAVHTPSQKGVKSGPCKIRAYWNKPPELEPCPEEYVEMVEKYGMTGEGMDVTIEKKNPNYEVKFE
ncbi:MAG: hypothetical protein HUK22_03965 [Thermoguttaceae bacterium]|nr:hypothetical protein [Thermoguttaceae bacterium]